MKKGNPYGTHRVISPKGVLPQPADVIDNDMEIYDNEVKIAVKTLNIDSASFTSVVDHACGKTFQLMISKRLRKLCSVSLLKPANTRTLGQDPAECSSELLKKSDRNGREI